MAKSKWWSSGRKPSTSSGENETAGTATPDSEGQEKSPSRFMRTLTGFRSGNKKDKSRSSRRNDNSSYGHLDRPFTQQNLEHQKILNAFAFSFGRTQARRASRGAHSHLSGISPCASRSTSVDGGASLSHVRSHGSDRRGTHPRFSGSLAHDAPQEVPGEESDQERGPVQALPNAPKVARVVSNHS